MFDEYGFYEPDDLPRRGDGGRMSNLVMGSICVAAFVGIVCFLLFCCLSGCAVNGTPTTKPSIVDHPINNVNQNIGDLQHGLTVLNYLGIFGAAVGLGLAIYALVTADKALERVGFIVACVAGSLCVVTLTGIIVLPFAPWVLLGVGVIALAGGAYEVYVRYFAVKTTEVKKS
jgi:hypothetical protein